MLIATQLKAAREKRAELVKALEALVTIAEESDRSLTEDETKTFESTKSDISLADDRIKRLEDTEKLIASNAKKVEANDELDVTQPNGLVIGRDTKRAKVKGAFFAKQAHFLFLAQGNSFVAGEMAERAGDKEMGAVLKAAANAATSTANGWASQLVSEEVTDFIDMLRPMSILSRMPAGSTFTFDDTNLIRIPKLTTGTPGGFVAEGGAIPVKHGVFDSITLAPSKIGVITVATREVLARSTPALETLLRDMMLRDTAIVLDRRFLSNLVAGGNAPAGLFHATNAAAPIAASNTANAADDAIADIKAMMQAMYTANVPLSTPVWLMHPSKKLDLMALRSATGVFYFRDELVGGTLQGFPVLDSSVFDFGVNNGGGSNIRTVALVDASLLARANGISPTISLSQDATLHMDDAPNADILVPAAGGRSLFQTDSSALRLTWETTWRTRHTVSVQYVSGVNW
jgi:HK97 family phage major capsid protein